MQKRTKSPWTPGQSNMKYNAINEMNAMNLMLMTDWRD